MTLQTDETKVKLVKLVLSQTLVVTDISYVGDSFSYFLSRRSVSSYLLCLCGGALSLVLIISVKVEVWSFHHHCVWLKPCNWHSQLSFLNMFRIVDIWWKWWDRRWDVGSYHWSTPSTAIPTGGENLPQPRRSHCLWRWLSWHQDILPHSDWR